jgi:hypothetical protein
MPRFVPGYLHSARGGKAGCHGGGAFILGTLLFGRGGVGGSSSGGEREVTAAGAAGCGIQEGVAREGEEG